MSNYSGVVRKIFPNQFGHKKLYSFSLQGQDGFFNLGERAPGFAEGQTVGFEAAPDKRPGNFKVLSDVKPVTDAPVSTEDYKMAAGAKRTVEMSKDDYWKNREDNDKKVQKVIQIQAARKAAIAVYSSMPVKDGIDVELFLNDWTDTFLKNNEDRLA